MTDLGQGFVDILPRSDSFTATLSKQVKESLTQVEGEATTASSKLMAGVNAGFLTLGVAAVAGIAKGIAATQEWAGEVRSLQKVTGLAAEDASKLTAAAEQMGIPVTKLSGGFSILANNIVNGSAKLAQYGVTTTDATGAALPFDEVLANLSDKFTTLPAGIEQTAFANAAFGKSGRDLIPILAKGSAGLQEQYDLAVKLGLVMSQEDLDAAKDLTVAQRELGEAFKGASITLAHDFIPVLTSITDLVTDAVALFQKIPQPVITTTAAILGLATGVRLLQGLWGFLQTQLAALGAGFSSTAQSTGTATEATVENTLATRDNSAAQLENVAAGELSTTTTEGSIAVTNASTASVDANLIAVHARNVALGEGIPIMNLVSSGTGLLAKAATILNSTMVEVIAPIYAFSVSLKAARAEIEGIKEADPVTVFNGIVEAGNKLGMFGAGNQFSKLADPAKDFRDLQEEVNAGLTSGTLTVEEATKKWQDFGAAVGFEVTPQMIAELQATHDLSLSTAELAEETAKAQRQEQAHTTTLGELARATQPISRYLDDMGMSARSFASEARQAFVAGTFDEWSADFRAKAVDVWQEFHDAAFGALDFASSMVGELGANLEKGEKLTASSILKTFDNAKAKTESFGRDLLEISKSGGAAAKSLASSLLESGNVLAAQVIADAPGKLQQQIVRSFGAGETAADNLATKLTNSIKGPLNDIKQLLIDLAHGWNIPVTADTSKAKYTIDNFLAAEGNHIITIGVQARNQFAQGGRVGFASGGSTDTIPAMLSPGEFVIRKQAVDKIGVGNLQRLNGGGTVAAVAGKAKMDGALRIYDWRNGLATLDAELGWEDAVRTR